MGINAPWNDRLAEPLSREHLVHVYRDDSVLVEAVALYAGRGLGKGEGVILVATPEHREAFAERLQAAGFDVKDLESWGQLTMIDAADLLSRFLVGGHVDATLFESILGDIIGGVRGGGRFQRIRVYGEMVDLLWRHNHPATRRLEELWNEAIAAHSVSLLCGYRVDAAENEAALELPADLRALHSHLIPAHAGI